MTVRLPPRGAYRRGAGAARDQESTFTTLTYEYDAVLTEPKKRRIECDRGTNALLIEYHYQDHQSNWVDHQPGLMMSLGLLAKKLQTRPLELSKNNVTRKS